MFSKIKSYLKCSEIEQFFSSYILAEKNRCTQKNDYLGRVYVENVDNLYYYAVFGLVALVNREYTYNLYESPAIYKRIHNKNHVFNIKNYLVELLKCLKWKSLYEVYAANTDRIYDKFWFLKFLWRIFLTLEFYLSKDKLINLARRNYKNVIIGDLVIDTYLKFGSRLEVDEDDFYLYYIYYCAMRDVDRAELVFNKNKPLAYITSFCTYLQHGVPVRVSLKHGCKVISFGNFQDIFKRITLTNSYETKNGDEYISGFHGLSNKLSKLAAANRGIRRRMMGGIDNSVVFMKRSVYDVVDFNWKPDGPFVVIFLHDFSDAPHIYTDMIFDDYYSWARTTINNLIESGITFYIKPHPNRDKLTQLGESKLKREYANCIRFVPDDISNAILVSKGMYLGFSIYGTVIGELAYLGVPTITCCRHAGHKFSFSINASSEIEYRSLITGLTSFRFYENSRRYKVEALIYYYMHNLNYNDEELEIRGRLMNLYRQINVDSTTNYSSLAVGMSEILNNVGSTLVIA